MDFWFFLLAALCVSISFHGLLSLLNPKRLPPCPHSVPILGSLLWLLRSSRDFVSVEPMLRHLKSKYGPIVRLQMGSRPAIFFMSHEVAHRVLIRHSAAFANRPQGLVAMKVLGGGERTVGTTAYTPLWRMLRHNLMSLIHPSRLKYYSGARKWAAVVLKEKLLAESARSPDGSFVVFDMFQLALFSLQALMCFGEKYDDETIKNIINVQRAAMSSLNRFQVFNAMPKLGKFVFRKLWKELLTNRRDQENVLLPLIKSRIEKRRNIEDNESSSFVCYIDTLVDLQLPDTKSRPTYGELVSLCTEFMITSTDTSIGTLQWVMANVVKHRCVQERVLREVNAAVEPGEEIKEGDLERMPYLKAVVLETLRRHPPGHFIFPRAVTEDGVKIDGYDIPRDAILNFAVAEMGRDPTVWEDPMEFKPERFLGQVGEGFDVKGVGGIKMMPFGAGMRICPAITIALLHLEYFVANMVREFEWRSPPGEDIDLTEVQDFSIVMKTPLRVQITPRCN